MDEGVLPETLDQTHPLHPHTLKYNGDRAQAAARVDRGGCTMSITGFRYDRMTAGVTRPSDVG
jgi:hypothetical protein